MRFEQLLGNAKWEILATVAENDASATEIARAAKMSLANVSQQAKLLEAYGLLTIRKEERTTLGKPKLIYRLGKELAHIAMARRGFAGQRTIALDPFHTAVLNIWFLPKIEDHYCLQKLFWQQEEYVEATEGIAVIDSSGNEIHLLVIAPEEHLEKLRKKFSKIAIKGGEKEKSVISWTHSAAELRDGLARKEEYFLKMAKRPHIIFDRSGDLQAILGKG